MKTFPSAGRRESLKGRRDSVISVNDEEVAASPLGQALGIDPAQRDPEAVREALDWWLEQLPARGTRLSAELAAGPALFQAFLRGRLSVAPGGQRLQEEGDEVRNYTIVLLGRCRLRCRVCPAPKGDAVVEVERELAAAGVEPDGCLTYGFASAGEALLAQQAPGEQRAACEAVATERVVLLILTPEDYTATLRPHQRDMQASAMDFLARHICPLAPPATVQRLAAAVRQRTVRRGKVLLRTGDYQRQILILRDGAVSIRPQDLRSLALEVDEVDSEEERQRDESDDEREQEGKLKGMREASVGGAQGQQAQALWNEKLGTACRHARGKLRRSLESKTRSRPPGDNASSVLDQPGQSLCEEVLLCDGLREMVLARSYFTARAEQDTVMYVLDLPFFRQLAMYAGVEQVAQLAADRMQRRCNHQVRNDVVLRSLGRSVRRAAKAEAARGERPQIRMPPSAGYEGPREVADPNSWMQITYEHRKAPVNDKNPATLKCLEAIENPRVPVPTNGPGVQSMLKAFADEASLKRFRISSRRNSVARRRGSGPGSCNPMGETGANAQAYIDAARGGEIASVEVRIQDAPATARPFAAEQPSSAAAAPAPGDVGEVTAAAGELPAAHAAPGIFFTETPVDEPFDPCREDRESGSAVADDAGEASAAFNAAPVPTRAWQSRPPSRQQAPLAATTSLPALSPPPPRAEEVSGAAAAPAHGGTSAGVGGLRGVPEALEQEPSGISLELSQRLPCSQSEASLERPGTRRRTREQQAAQRDCTLAKRLAKVLRGKSVLVLTDKVDVRKSVCGAMIDAPAALCFVQNTNELWQRLRNKREQPFHALVLDLTKAELPAEAVIRTMRQHEIYGRLPIVVLAQERELSDAVRANCNFVVFLPIVSSMLREALLWCFNCHSVQLRQKKLEAEENLASLLPGPMGDAPKANVTRFLSSLSPMRAESR
eukprot:TRINITY_DN16542_c0_g1_i1.p1 TRINITY_DN16542_c0_g1~~TRINITY_DN16542_c0_g1_i1.p1  ORF type:complete len:948 (+),score=207.83 TRINITY_DN16542_c0_g1_i1:195-3038(+)